MTVDTQRLADATHRGWTQATDHAALLTQAAGVSWREAHQILARLVRESVAEYKGQDDITPAYIDRVALAVIGRPLAVPAEAIRSAVEPRQSIDNRKLVQGSPAPANVEAQIAAARDALKADVARIDELATRKRKADARLEAAIDAIAGARN